MKTIKELNKLVCDTTEESVFFSGFFSALNDVIELIDELWGEYMSIKAEELKKRITGT